MSYVNGDKRSYLDEEYDVFAVMDNVPMVVKSVARKESRFVSLLSAFFGIDSEFIGGAGP